VSHEPPLFFFEISSLLSCLTVAEEDNVEVLGCQDRLLPLGPRDRIAVRNARLDAHQVETALDMSLAAHAACNSKVLCTSCRSIPRRLAHGPFFRSSLKNPQNGPFLRFVPIPVPAARILGLSVGFQSHLIALSYASDKRAYAGWKGENSRFMVQINSYSKHHRLRMNTVLEKRQARILSRQGAHAEGARVEFP